MGVAELEMLRRQFGADAAHELRTPLAALRVLLEEAQLYPDDVDPYAALRAALREAERLEAIVGDLLVLASLNGVDTVSGEVVDMAELVAAEITNRPSPLSFTRPMQTVPVCGSREHLSRLIRNLFDNAEVHARSLVAVRLSQDGDQAVLSVTDDGAGGRAEDRERVPEPFAPMEAARAGSVGGTGLGLAIAQRIATAYNGSLVIEDGPVGARLVLRLTLVSVPATR